MPENTGTKKYIGRVSIIPKNEWSADENYSRLDLVTFNGGSYLSKKDKNRGENPQNSTSWLQIAPNIDNSLTVSNAAASASKVGEIRDASLLVSNTNLPSGTDLNDVKQNGIYKLQSGFNYVNKPDWFVGGYLIVIKFSNNNITQYVVYRQSLTFAKRGSTNNVWSEWSENPIDKINKALVNITENTLTGWESGTYNPTNGAIATAPYNIRSRQPIGFINGVNEIICKNNGYVFTVFAYLPDGSYVGNYKSNGQFLKDISTPAFCTHFTCSLWKDYVFYISLRKKESEQPIELNDSTNLVVMVDNREKNPWFGKTAYFYGTSLTRGNIQVNNELSVPYWISVGRLLGLYIVNKGIAGQGIGNLGANSTGAVYDAIHRTDDGKTSADLIVLETAANDINANVSLGTIYDTGTNTLAGCLNDCIRYLQENTEAQIVVTLSSTSNIIPNLTDQVWEWKKMVRDICFINSVHFIECDCNIGASKAISSNGNKYLLDQIHLTRLGAYVVGTNFANKLKNVPEFYH